MAYLMVGESVVKYDLQGAGGTIWYIWKDVQGDFTLGLLHSSCLGSGRNNTINVLIVLL
jgi:hypothetical protein